LGLEEPAMNILNNSVAEVNLFNFIKPNVTGLSSYQDIEDGVVHIIADVIGKDKDAVDFIRKQATSGDIRIESSTAKASNKKENVDEKVAAKFHLYTDFQQRACVLQPHQVLGINRGENLKVLSVKVQVPPAVQHCFQQIANRKWDVRQNNSQRAALMHKAIEMAYSKRLQPFLCRLLRSELTKKAEVEALRIFCCNLRNLLLTPPVRGKVILGIDPGFSHGCKSVVISKTGEVLETAILNLHNNRNSNNDRMNAATKLEDMISSWNVSIIAIGNGTACRETEKLISDLMSRSVFRTQDVVYSVVNESGSSVYSVSDQGERDLPGLIPNLRSAVTIARRVQDPLTEYVKVEPKHIGVGMYQHDMPESKLQTSLESVMIECVSFVGVDLNTCPEIVLKKVAGMTAARAKSIIKWRTESGPFINRQQLLTVTGIGPKTFEQCAGFVRIMASDSATGSIPTLPVKKGRGKKMVPLSLTYNPLDMTCIHPESYSVATRFIEEVGGRVEDVGKTEFINKVKAFMRGRSIDTLADQYAVGVPTMKLIIEGLQQPMDYDYRSEFSSPVFSREMTSIDSLKTNTVVTGCVRNVTSFGAFVDIGVGNDGLMHNSRIPQSVLQGRDLAVGSRVEVKVLSVEVNKKRISLQLIKLL